MNDVKWVYQDIVDESERRLRRANLLEAQLAKASSRIQALEANIQAMAEDALSWVPRAEFDEKMALADEYCLSCYTSGTYMTFVEWLGDKDL